MIPSINIWAQTDNWGVKLASTVLAAVAVGLSACSTDAEPTSGGANLRVVTSFYPMEFLVSRIGGDRIEVVSLMPAGVAAHDFEPSPQDVVSLHKADLFVYNGAGFEPWGERLVALLSKGSPTMVNATVGLDLIVPEDRGEGRRDPHVWLDPQRYGEQASLIHAALMQVDPVGAVVYDANLARLKAELRKLGEEMEAGLVSCKHNAVVTSHAAFAYLTDRFGLQQLAIAGLSPEVEPSPARMKAVVELVHDMGTTHIFVEPLASSAVADTVAREIGAQTLVLNPLEGLTQDEVQAGDDYFTVMRKNLSNIRTALACP